jgi:hypothetical protein
MTKPYHTILLPKVTHNYPKCYPKLPFLDLRFIAKNNRHQNIRENKMQLSRKLFFEISYRCIKVAPLSLG